MTDRWRGIVALLLNPETRAVLAEAMADQPSPSVARRERAIERLESAGLVQRQGDALVFRDDALRALLAEAAPSGQRGIERFLEPDGRVGRLPVRPRDRRDLLVWVRERVIATDEVLAERNLNDRLSELTTDTAGLRRALVDEGLLERTRSGSQYAWPTSGD